jgi:hypothetical protein
MPTNDSSPASMIFKPSSPISPQDMSNASGSDTSTQPGKPKRRYRDPKWDKKYESKRKAENKRGHATNLFKYQKDLLNPELFKDFDVHHLTAPIDSYPGVLDTLLQGLIRLQPSDGSHNFSFNQRALEEAQYRLSEGCKINNGEGGERWRVWIPQNMWRRFSICKESCTPEGTTMGAFVEMLLAFGRRREGHGGQPLENFANSAGDVLWNVSLLGQTPAKDVSVSVCCQRPLCLKYVTDY